MAATDQAFVIGIRTYPKMRSLRGPCHDAEEFRDWLVDPNGGDVPAENVKFLITEASESPDATHHPNVSEIEELFGDVVHAGAQAANAPSGLGRRMYIYMAGHGFSEVGNMTEVALLGANASTVWAPNVAATRWAEWFRLHGVFHEIVLIMDCCRTTSPIAAMASPPFPKTMGSPRRTKVKKFYAYAVADGEAAREEEGPDGEWGGIFTRALLDAFRSAGPDESGRVHGRVVADYLHQTVGGKQTPEFDIPFQHDIVFAQRQDAAPQPVRLRLAPFAGGETVIVLDHDGTEVMRIDPRDASFAVDLRPGLYKAILQELDRKTLFEVPGDEVVL